MERRPEQPEPFDISGGALCLDFANTVGDRPRRTMEKLHHFEDFLRWCLEVGILDEAGRDRLAGEAARHPRLAREALRRAIGFRETLYGIFSSLAGGGSPGEEDLETFNRVLGEALRHLRVEPEGEGFGWAWSKSKRRFDHLTWPIARSAGELLTSSEKDRVRECALDSCSWLFVDRSRNHRRRWCDMKVCGNRAKARRHYSRKKQASRR